MGFALVVLNSHNSSLIISTISSSYKSHTSPLTSLSAYPGYKTGQKNRSMTRRRTTNSTGNLRGGVLILVENGLTYSSLSTQSLSSLGSRDYLAIAVKIKGASPIHLFNVYVPPIRFSDSRPKSLSPFLLPSSPTTYIFGDFNSHHSSWDSHPKTNQAKSCLIGSSLLIFYLLTTPNITPYYTMPPETALPLIFP